MFIELIAAGAGLVSVPAIGWWALRDYSPPVIAVMKAIEEVAFRPKPEPVAPSLPAPEPWSREDARRAAEMYRKVPSAFWLAPEYTRYDGPEEPVWDPKWTQLVPPPPPKPAELQPEQRAKALPQIVQGRRVVSYSRDEARMGWNFQLEPKAYDTQPAWAFWPDSTLNHWRVFN